MPEDTTIRASQREQRPADVTDPLLWQLAVDVLSAHEPDENGACHNLLCAGQPWPCAARGNAEQSLRLARGVAGTPSRAASDRGGDGVPAARRGWSTGQGWARPGTAATAAA
ncbi:hypothetical protein [Micromonospora sp. 067-2]|uniref:hypothetical protein n=1 Tax=Micromonospora sp. 067-2 TaxID=2789270 RepID=UPI003979E37E